MTFHCPGCDQEKDASEFAAKNKAKGTRQRWCRACQAVANKKHYLNNKQIYITRAITRSQQIIEEHRKKIYAYLSKHPCIDCGNTDIRVLEFDHVYGTKAGNITHMLHRAFPWPLIEEEIAKCEVRCANCHRIKTMERGNQWRFDFAPNE